MSEISPALVREVHERLTKELGRVIVGQNRIIELLLISLFARGHCLLVGVPGLAKTLLVKALSEVLHLSFKRIQFTPDLMPADIIGSELLQERDRREFAGKKLADVGCESCHGPGSLHVEQHRAGGQVTFKFRPLGAGDCRKCHHGEFSRPFDWEVFWPHIQHGKEPAKAAARP